MNREYVKVRHWGPCLGEFKLSDDQVKRVSLLCKKDPELDYRKELAGHLRHEYSINRPELQNIIQDYLNYYKKLWNFYYNRKEERNLKITSAWVNYMQAGDFNPPHIHGKCHVSAVLYLKVPKEIKKEYDERVNAGGGPGEIVFLNGLAVEDFITEHKVFPEEGLLFLFPWNLLHIVTPFKSDAERISVAFNAVWE
jgi:uncharacterized protein (TIGR02466 family)